MTVILVLGWMIRGVIKIKYVGGTAIRCDKRKGRPRATSRAKCDRRPGLSGDDMNSKVQRRNWRKRKERFSLER